MQTEAGSLSRDGPGFKKLRALLCSEIYLCSIYVLDDDLFIP